MTREEAITVLSMVEAHGSLVVQAKDMAIKALEQPSVLDKIRAEIEEHRRKTQYIDPYDLVGDCLDIINEYRVESEVEE